MCKQVGPDAPGKKYDDNATCASVCPPTPQPTPPETRGIWRGITIHKAYQPGEWVANITANYLTIWYPTPTGWELFCEGAASAIAHGAAQTYIITVSSTAGKLKGAIRFLAADYSMDPEMTSFLQLAVQEELPSTEVSDFDTAMTTATVISLETCPSGGTPVPPPPPPGPPPPCKAKLDVMIVLDGSASIQPPDWQKALSFTNQVIDGFSISKDEVEIGIVQFSSISTLEIGLSPDKAAIQAIVTNLPQMMSNTDTYAGFETAQTEIRAHRRPNTNGTLVIILTDGKQNQGQPASVITDQLKTVDKAEIFGIGVGPDIDEPELQSWCSTPLPQHYFKVDDWADLHKIIDQIVANACPQPHPPSSPQPPLRQHGDYCRFHLPSPLPVTVQRAAVSAEAAVRVLDEIDEIDATDEKKKPPRRKLQRTLAKDGLAPSDPCNPYANCSSCIAARPAFGQTCGWCSGDLKYSGETNVSKFKCAGKDQGNSSAKFTCSGNFQTTSCEVPGDCGLKGVYRGIRVDHNYTFGEWQAVFTPQTLAPNGTATGEFVKIDQLDMSGKVTSTIDGKIECTTKCTFADTIEGAPFKITASSGKIYYGICGYTHQFQAETDGLMWAVSDAGSTQAPKNFDVAMNSSNATVYTYYKCSEYKGATCQFKAV